ncbi:hypothetical protein LZ30DRAFT_725403 [Colletotrichum cereale]|nr:hypothetical protein LZ30DRAFT_725403 [Colletotrichum cereale]
MSKSTDFDCTRHKRPLRRRKKSWKKLESMSRTTPSQEQATPPLPSPFPGTDLFLTTLPVTCSPRRVPTSSCK